MRIKKSEFVISVAQGSDLPTFDLPEIAVAGKSNVGKSSFINMMTNVGNLARVSSEPGRTRLINYFKVNGEFFLVDLPGYGYAKVSDDEKLRWASLTDAYFADNQNLKCVFVLLDCRHKPTADDLMLVNFLVKKSLPFCVIATKCDKLSRQQLTKAVQELASTVKLGKDDIICTSAKDKVGVEKVLQKFDVVLSNA